jgi:hypothetical protein
MEDLDWIHTAQHTRAVAPSGDHVNESLGSPNTPGI